MEPQMKFFYPKVKAVDVDNRRITVCISKDEIDRHEERIEIQAIADALAGYASNPVVLGDHQHRLPSGQSSVIGHGPPDSYRVLPDEVDIDIVFSTTANAETYWINYRDGHQKAVSIGFIAKEWRSEEVEGKKVWVYTSIELLEVSCVAVGSNRGALVKTNGHFDQLKDGPAANEKNTILEAFLSVIREDMNHLGLLFNQLKGALAKDVTDIQDSLEEIKTLLTPGQDGFARELMSFGEQHDRSVPAVDTKTAEQILQVIETALAARRS